MIESKELRIGNLIYDDEGLICTVTGLSPHEHLVRCDTEEGCQIMIDFIDIDGSVVTGYVLGSDSAYAISLTEDWLVKFGFEELPKTTQHHADMKSNYHCPVLWLNEYTYLASNAKTPTGYLFLNNYRIDCKYVHQLQNLYFALTGKELTIASADPQQ